VRRAARAAGRRICGRLLLQAVEPLQADEHAVLRRDRAFDQQGMGARRLAPGRQFHGAFLQRQGLAREIGLFAQELSLRFRQVHGKQLLPRVTELRAEMLDAHQFFVTVEGVGQQNCFLQADGALARGLLHTRGEPDLGHVVRNDLLELLLHRLQVPQPDQHDEQHECQHDRETDDERGVVTPRAGRRVRQGQVAGTLFGRCWFRHWRTRAGCARIDPGEPRRLDRAQPYAAAHRKLEHPLTTAHLPKIQLGCAVTEPEGEAEVLDLVEPAALQAVGEALAEPVAPQVRRDDHAKILRSGIIDRHVTP
jgi:hypothetical protein